MTPELERRWKNKLSPFDGVTIHTEEEFGVSKLRQIIMEIVYILEHRSDYIRVEFFDDWHEHDGYITDSTSITWKGIHDWLKDEKSLYRQCYTDDEVSIAIYPLTFEWYLRIEIGDNPDDMSEPTDMHNAYYDFDFTGNLYLAKTMKDVIQEKIGINVKWTNAKKFFDMIYGGGSSFLPGDPVPPGVFS